MNLSASTWEELIEHKKLPFMAMLRNLRNLILTGVKPRYHRWVQNKLTNEQTIANSRQFPFRFFSAFEVIPKDLEDFQKILARANKVCHFFCVNKFSIAVVSQKIIQNSFVRFYLGGQSTSTCNSKEALQSCLHARRCFV